MKPTPQHHPTRWGYLGLGFLMAHELDAVRCYEWRMLPFLSLLNDHDGYQVFTLLHIPIYTAILWGMRLPGNLGRKHPNRMLYRFSVFNIIHAGLHLLALGCPRNQFTSPVSWFLILGGGLCGMIDVHLQSFK